MKRTGIGLRQILFAAAAIGMSDSFHSSVFAGTFSTGLGNTTPGAIDPAIPGFVGSLGDGKSTAPNTVNPAFVGWATGVTSYLPAGGVVEGWDSPGAALGPVTGDNTDIVSLGDLSAAQIAAHATPGQITLSFNSGIGNRAGADFAVFENALGTGTSVFAELGFVEVSSDGSHFARFPNTSLTLAAVGPYGSVNPTDVHNLAGKHVNAYGNSWGTPFDLSDLASNPLVQSGDVKLNGIRYVRIVDIPGDGSFKDSNNRPIYDAWETTESGGFDLEAIGVTHGWLGGDANLDGLVDARDLGILASHWQQPGYGFEGGNFNGSGLVDISDLLILAQNWPTGGQSFAASLASLDFPTSSIPEPTALGAVVAAGALLVRRRSSTKQILDFRRNAQMFRAFLIVLITSIPVIASADTATFEDLGLPANSFHDNSSFVSGGVQFNNATPFPNYWEGFAYSSKTDSTTAGFGNQYSAITGHGAGNSNTYGVAYDGGSFRTVTPTITLPAGVSAVSMAITNTTYAYLSLRDGDAAGKQFGGATGNDPDFFKLTITGKNVGNSIVGTVDFYLADYRFADNVQDYLVNNWTTVDLASLSSASSLEFTLSSSDNGQFGMNTPAYFAMDNLTVVPEPATVAMALLLAGASIGRRRRTN